MKTVLGLQREFMKIFGSIGRLLHPVARVSWVLWARRKKTLMKMMKSIESPPASLEPGGVAAHAVPGFLDPLAPLNALVAVLRTAAPLAPFAPLRLAVD